MEQKRYYLSETDKKIAGVCGGIAEYFNVDSLLVRVAFLLFIFSFGGGLIAYIVLWLCAPKRIAS
ncbi:MAG: PspC domain-containing protein [Prevotella sp.]|jgi:phage shock protein C|nr:PspC domain-containing protein [Prevotella sp.]